MKKGIMQSYIAGIKDASGETYQNILKFFIPELVTAFFLYAALSFIDARWIAHLKSTSTYATLGVTNGVIHFLIKIAEGLSVGSVILCGQFNGNGNFSKVGRTLIDTFWITFILGTTISLLLYFGAHWVYLLLGVPEEMISIGIPFLRLKAIGIFFTFVYFSFIAFLRGIKNTRTTMYIFFIGAIFFIFFDYALIFGEFGFPQLKLNGSAFATIIQYSVMLFMSVIVVLYNKDYKKYCIQLFSSINDLNNIKRLLLLSLPVVFDKATMAASYIWLSKMIAPMGKIAIASFTVIKQLEMLAFLPAIAFAQVITFLVSNDFGASNYVGIKSNIKKIIFLSSILVFIFLAILVSNPKFFIQIFDKKHDFTDFSSRVFPIISIFVFFDLIQIILSGALRGIGDVSVVMWTRIIICFGFFCPISYMICQINIGDPLMKFVLIYGMFYIGNGLMSLVYINKFRSYSWNYKKID